MENSTKNNYFATIIALSVFFGLVAGFVGELLTKTYLLNSFYDLPVYGDLNYSPSQARSGLTIRNAKQVVVQQNDKIDETVGAARGSLAGIFKKQAEAPSGFAVSNYYLAKDAVAEAMIMTSDGWLVTNYSALPDRQADFSNYVIVTYDRKVYQLDAVVKDKFSKFVYFHVPARELPIRKFAEADSVKNGQLVVAIDWQGRSWANLISSRYQLTGGVNSSDLPFEKIGLDHGLPAEYKGLAVINLAGEVVGLVNADRTVEPAGHFSAAVSSLLKYKAIKRPSLGLNYIPTLSLAGLPNKSVASNPELNNGTGVIVYRNDVIKSSAVVKGSPAEAIGLKEGDVILSFDGSELNSGADLAYLVGQLNIGDTASLVYLRAGARQEVEVSLKELK